MKSIRTLIVLGAMALATTACAQQKITSKPYIWYDGGKPRQIWLDNSLVADLGKRGAANASAAASKESVRILNRAEKLGQEALQNSTTAEVFRDSPNGPVRTLPGNVIVRLDAGWTREQVDAWLVSNALPQGRRLSANSNLYVIPSPPGLASLELANRLQESGGVVWAQPDWWQPVEPQ